MIRQDAIMQFNFSHIQSELPVMATIINLGEMS